MKTTINERLKKAINHVKLNYNSLSQEEIATELGYNPKYFSGLKNEKIPLSEEFAKRFEAKYEINSHWLMRGEGDMLIHSTDVDPINNLFNPQSNEEMGFEKMFFELMKTVERKDHMTEKLQNESNLQVNNLISIIKEKDLFAAKQHEDHVQQVDRLISLLEKAQGSNEAQDSSMILKKRKTGLEIKPR